MKGSGISSSKPIKSTPILPNEFEMDPEAEIFKLKQLPLELQRRILSKGLKNDAFETYAERLSFASSITPSIQADVNFLLPTDIKIQKSGITETISFDTSSEYKEYFEKEFITNSDTITHISISGKNIRIDIPLYKSLKSGSISIYIQKPNHTSMAYLTLNYEKVKNAMNSINLSKVLLSVNIDNISDLKNISDIIVGVRWLSLIFKKINWDKNILIFENPNNIKLIMNNTDIGIEKSYSGIIPGLLTLLKYIELNLKQKRITKSNRAKLSSRA